jgi:3-oxoacyl-[acyl-carrier-protein] synthase II
MTARRGGTARIAVTGVGAVSGFGAGLDALWRGVVEGRRAVAARPELAGLAQGPIALAPTVPFDAPARAAQLAIAAAREAVDDAGVSARGARVGVTLGTTLGGIHGWLRTVREHVAAPDGDPAAPRRWTWSGPARAIADELHAEGPTLVASVACASGNAALGLALDLLRRNACDVVVAGGADALSDFVIAGFGCLKACDAEASRPFDRTRRGLNLGEGAAFLVLEREAEARARGARVRAFLDGYGSAADAVHMTGPDREGRGAARAMRAALDDARLAAGDVGHVSSHGTATVFNDLMEGKALALALGEHAGRVAVNSVKGALGHTLGAAGALEAAICVRVLETRLVPPTAGLSERDPDIPLDVVAGTAREVPSLGAVLSTSSGFGGTNAAVVLRRGDS